MVDQIELPPMLDELEVADAEAFLDTHTAVTTGQVDTDRPGDLPDGLYDVEITSCGCRTRRDSEGTVVYPNLCIRMTTATGTTFTWFLPTFHAKAGASRMFTQRILVAFQKLLGAKFQEVQSPKAESYTFRSKVDYYNALGEKVVGLKARVRKYTENEYPQLAIVQVL